MDDSKEEYRAQVESFLGWCDNNYFQFHLGRLLVEQEEASNYHYHLKGRDRCGEHVYNFLRTHMNNVLFLRRLRSFNACNRMLQMFHQTVGASSLSFAMIMLGGSIDTRDANKLNNGEEG